MGALEGILKLEPNLFGLDPDTDKPYTAAQIYSFLRYASGFSFLLRK